MTATFSLNFAALSIDCADPAAVAGFWGMVLGRPVTLGAVPGDMAVDATDPDSGPWMLFHPVPDPEAAKNRLRPVLLTETYDEETGRLTGLGARPVNDADQAFIGSYTLISAGMRYSTRIFGRRASFQANLENAANRRYWSAAGSNQLAVGLGRTLELSSTFDF